MTLVLCKPGSMKRPTGKLWLPTASLLLGDQARDTRSQAFFKLRIPNCVPDSTYEIVDRPRIEPGWTGTERVVANKQGKRKLSDLLGTEPPAALHDGEPAAGGQQQGVPWDAQTLSALLGIEPPDLSGLILRLWLPSATVSGS